MSVEKKKNKQKISYAVFLIFLYFASFILVNVGFYLPYWFTSYEQGANFWDEDYRKCNEVGLITGDCRYPYTGIDQKQGSKGFVIRTTFYMMSTAMIFLYMSFFFLMFGLMLNSLENPIFMAFGSIIAGVLYPAAAVLTIAASVYAELSNTSKIGYAAIITNVGGGLMMVSYVMLRMYEKVFKKKGMSIESDD